MRTYVKRALLSFQIALIAEGVLLILRTPQLIKLLGRAIHDPSLQLVAPLWQAYAEQLHWAIPILGISAIITAWALMDHRPWGRRAAYGLSALHVGLAPFLTPLGLFGIFVLYKTRDRIDLASRMFWGKREVQQAKLPLVYRIVSLSVVLAAGIGIFGLIRFAQSARIPVISVWALPVVLLVAIVTTSVIHELGHVIAGKFARFQVSHASVGPLWFGHFPTGWSMRFIPDLSWSAAFAAARPQTVDNLRVRLMVFLAGGPAASLVFGATCLGVFLFSGGTFLESAADLFGIFAVVAFFDCLTELSLARKGHGFTDGSKIIQLWEDGRDAERLLATYVMGVSETTPVRPQNWKESWVLQATSDPKANTYFVGCYYAYIYHLDREDTKSAGEWLDRILEFEADNPDGVRRWKAAVEGAYFEAVHRCAPARARYWIGQPKQGVAADPVSELRAEAAVLYSENRMSEAGGMIIRARQLLSTYPETGLTAFESHLLDDLNRRILAVRPATLALKQLSLVVDKDRGSHPDSPNPGHTSGSSSAKIIPIDRRNNHDRHEP